MFGSKVASLWLIYLIRGLAGRRRFVCVTPPGFKNQKLYDRKEKKWVTLRIRDDDDWIQIEHIFLNDEFDLGKTGRLAAIGDVYARLSKDEVPLIVDLGANIGLASAYFSKMWPAAKIVSVEPDPGNCGIARHNLPAQSTLIEAAVASHGGSVALIDTGRNCGFQVDPNASGSIPLVTVNGLLADAGGTAPFIIKIDIEGFEEDLFSDQLEWIDRFPVLFIELHDWMLPERRVAHNFIKAMAARDRELIHFNGYVVSLALQPAAGQPIPSAIAETRVAEGV